VASVNDVGKILDGLWRFEGVHPEWTEDEGGEDGWEAAVAWWALAGRRGLILIDPLVSESAELDGLVESQRRVAGIIRTCHWHERSVTDLAARYGAEVWAKPPTEATPRLPYDHAVGDGDELLDGLRATDVERHDEIALWLPAQRALVFGDAMIRRASGELRVCPESWTQPPGGPARLKEILERLRELPVEHVLVSHGPLVLGDGAQALRQALDRA
jgi:glyoxylase-like metal-dependent hydrolase (beta-lactamase superfamily II)